ncbi:MAG: bifunctional deaminase-reductase domain protein [Bacteroidota bacterium]|jgi:dihydrofolate reductase|nr:bifunctional deaminase-reductase domain protein [Bacteroidota bacterium]
MRKIIAAINQTIDGFCDHTAGIPDEELHEHYRELLNGAEAILYGRKTFELMKFWQTLIEKPSGEKAMDDFAVAIDRVPKIVFSNTLNETGWNSATLVEKPIEEIVSELKKQKGKDIFIGSRSLIVQLANLHLIDEFQLCIHPVLIGTGLPLFDEIKERTVLKLLKTKTFSSGAIILYYQAIR